MRVSCVRLMIIPQEPIELEPSVWDTDVDRAAINTRNAERVANYDRLKDLSVRTKSFLREALLDLEKMTVEDVLTKVEVLKLSDEEVILEGLRGIDWNRALEEVLSNLKQDYSLHEKPLDTCKTA